MGERFVLYRLPSVDEVQQARMALAHAGHEAAMREELAGAVSGLFAALDLETGQPWLTAEESDRLIALATLAVRCRSAVERDGHSRDIELIPEPEAPGRLALVLARLLRGLSAIGVTRAEAWRTVVKAALDSMPALRRRMLEMLMNAEQPRATSDLARANGYPTTTARRTLEDLAAHHVVVRVSQGEGRADLWQVSEWARERWTASVPETSVGLYFPHRVYDDFSGTV